MRTAPNLALFLRTLTMDGRHWVGYALRLLMLGTLAMTLVQFLLSSMVSAQSAAPGLEFFSLIASTNLFFISICGVVVFATAITEEKEVGSLGLLMMTGLTPLTTLLSKGTSKLLVGAGLVMAQLPFSILAVTLGGVGQRQVLAAYAAILAYMFFVGNLALFFSVVSSRSAKAMTLTFLILITFNVAVLIYPETRWMSPGVRMGEILATGFSGPVAGIFEEAMVATGLLFFMLSLAIFNSLSREIGDDTPSVSRTPWSMGGRKFRLFPVPRTWRDAITWKEFYFSHGGAFGILGVSLIMVASTATGAYLFSGIGVLSPPELGTIMFVVGCAVLTLQGIQVSSTIFGSEIHGKTYPLLALLPWSKHRLAYSKLLGASIFMLPSLAFAMSGLAVMVASQSVSISESLALTAVHAIPQCVLYYYLVVYFSFKIRFGAFVVAAFVLGAIQTFMGVPMGLLLLLTNALVSSVGGGLLADFAAVLLNGTYAIVICGSIIVFIHRLIGAELDHAAGT